MVRILPAQDQIISAFTADVAIEPKDLHLNHQGTRSGYSLGSASVVDHKGESQPGCTLQLVDGTQLPYGFDRKAYTVLDGSFIFSREPLLRNGHLLTMGVYRKWTKAKYILARSHLIKAIDGKISEINSKSVTIISDFNGETHSFPIESNAQFKLNGQHINNSSVIQPGMKVTIFQQRPQVIEAMTAGQPTPGYGVTKSAGEERQYAIIDYDHEGNRRVLRDGYNPYFDDPRTKDSPPSPNSGPPGWHNISREKAMAVHPDA